jgi:two-component system sensor histidine kinase CpxA
MKSIYTKIGLWSFGSLLISLVAFLLVTQWIGLHNRRQMFLMPRLPVFTLEEVRRQYETGGPRAAALSISHFDSAFEVRHYLVDGDGRDVVTGESRQDLLKLASRPDPLKPSPEGIIVALSTDGKFRLIIAGPRPFAQWRYYPYYGLILLAVAILGWPLATNIGSPLRILSEAVDHFGEGDMSTRLRFRRRDEIGHLANSFDRMADRIETLLVAERRLLQDVSHELRAPLARLSFAVELARKAPDRDAAIDRIKNEASRLDDLIGTLIEVTRNEGDPASFARKTFALDDLVREVVQDCRLEAVAEPDRILLVKDAALSIAGDREVMRRALENVVRNATYYSPRDTRIEVSMASSSNGARIVVRDYGPGVPDHLLRQIFKPFFRVDDSRNSATGGIGLGLAIAFRAVQLHNGTISASNAHPGLMIEIDLPGARG